ncbi:phosphate transporter (Pho88) [Leucoagaricus gongylophorus]
MNPAVQNVVVSLVAMQLARRIAFDDPLVLSYVRIGYAAAQLVILATYYYVSLTVKRKNDHTVLKYVEAPNPMTQDQGKLVTTTVRDYDLAEVSKLLRSAYFGIAMMAVMHGYFKFTQPLFVQALMGLKGLFDAKPVSIHILNKPATGDLKRPFTTPSLMGPAQGPMSDPASIAEAEKRAGAKKED